MSEETETETDTGGWRVDTYFDLRTASTVAGDGRSTSHQETNLYFVEKDWSSCGGDGGGGDCDGRNSNNQEHSATNDDQTPETAVTEPSTVGEITLPPPPPPPAAAAAAAKEHFPSYDFLPSFSEEAGRRAGQHENLNKIDSSSSSPPPPLSPAPRSAESTRATYVREE